MQDLEAVKKWYPNAKTTIDAVNIVFDIIEAKLKLKPHQLMMADSVCCDDVNTIQYPPRAYEMLGPFKMGGLDGYPFAGLTGMGAFAHHVPEDGAVLVFYAPHIGITKDGTLGEIHRIGQSKNSACCGAAKGALGKLLKNEIVAGNISEIDYQMNTIEQLFLKQESRIKSAENQLYEATQVMYEAIDGRIEELVSKTQYPCKYVILIGAIYINGDKTMGSFCTYNKFDVIDLSNQERHSMLNEFNK